MKLFGNSRFWLLASLLAVASGLVGCDGSEADEQKEAPVWPVKIATISNAGDIEERQFAGRVRAVQTLDLSFQVGGKLNQFNMTEGEIVPKGTLIASLDSQDFNRRVREAEVNVELLEKTVARQRSLAERNVISRQQLDETESNFSLAKVALENAAQNLAYTRLQAPFDALITRRLVENYTNVQSGQGIVRLQDVSEVRIEVSVPEKLLATIDRDHVKSITASFEFLPGKEFPLEYREHQAEANSVTQTYIVELGMPRPADVQILPGMTARVNLKLHQAGRTYRVPLSAVQTDADGSSFVWRINGDQSVSKASVLLGSTDGDSVEITRGIESAMNIVAAGGQHLYEGAKVRNYRQ
ncbi:efflux RND transporter periplasmic adaptor subunit [Microbulbifer rhizosphaerae]|uniref:RND family efflux transporter MFP subunit n=1 Tax=Microbulbifer rhizosphaerae TaxID=1562603 RepID=A0A7W4WB38_9GAMM|nr:efflux RND transporter periplasmic adaptor subunit [Microbulbifer rhizosphaerae]MBB3060427.1 RND family efflux transporter MFP subunit [Microbulbifer rhizosphaerae]